MTEQPLELMSTNLIAALVRAQSQMRNVGFDRINPHFKSKYASLPAILDMIRKPLADNGLAITQTMHEKDGKLFLLTVLHYVDSDSGIASYYLLPTNMKSQDFGAVLTYARRYSISALLNISSDDDDDGNAAQGAKVNGSTAKEIPPLISDEALGHAWGKIQEMPDIDMGKLLKLFKINDLAELPASEVNRLMNLLDERERKMKGKKL